VAIAEKRYPPRLYPQAEPARPKRHRMTSVEGDNLRTTPLLFSLVLQPSRRRLGKGMI